MKHRNYIKIIKNIIFIIIIIFFFKKYKLKINKKKI